LSTVISYQKETVTFLWTTYGVQLFYTSSLVGAYAKHAKLKKV